MLNIASDRPCRIGVAGAGLLGRLCAWHLSRLGHAVSVFDPAPGPAPRHDVQGAAGFTAAGMLSPLAELDAAEPDVAGRGWHSIPRWAAIAAELVAGTAGGPPPGRPGGPGGPSPCGVSPPGLTLARCRPPSWRRWSRICTAAAGRCTPGCCPERGT